MYDVSKSYFNDLIKVLFATVMYLNSGYFSNMKRQRQTSIN